MSAATVLARLWQAALRHDQDTGRHRCPGTAPADWSPIPPSSRQRMAPTHYADRALHAGADDTTGFLDTTEATQ